MDKRNRKSVDEEWEGNDECEICRVMEKGLGDNCYGDLAEAFARQNAKQKAKKRVI